MMQKNPGVIDFSEGIINHFLQSPTEEEVRSFDKIFGYTLTDELYGKVNDQVTKEDVVEQLKKLLEV